MPEKIERRNVERNEEKRYKQSGRYLFACFDVGRYEVQRQKYKRERSGVNKGQTLGAHGVIGADKQLCDHVEPFKALIGLEIRV